MSDLLTHIERSELVDVDLDKEPQCESAYHHPGGTMLGVPQNHHGGPATHFQVTPCGHGNGLRCAPHVAAIEHFGGGFCTVCMRANDLAGYRFIEL